MIKILALVLLCFPIALQAQECPEGQTVTVDTAGHCCWSGQVWHSATQRCVGIPTECPEGLGAEGEACAEAKCPDGKTRTTETHGECCWPGQAWSSLRKQCVGIPTCPEGRVVHEETCEAETAALRVNARPSARVFIDGALVGETPLELELVPGTHTLRLESSGGKVSSKTITVEAGKTLAVVHKF